MVLEHRHPVPAHLLAGVVDAARPGRVVEHHRPQVRRRVRQARVQPARLGLVDPVGVQEQQLEPGQGLGVGEVGQAQVAELFGAVAGADVVVAEGRPQRPAPPQGPVGLVELGGEQLRLAPLVDVVAGGHQGVDPVGGRPALHRPGHRRLGRPAAGVAEGDQTGADRAARDGGGGRRWPGRGPLGGGAVAAADGREQRDDPGQQRLPAGQGPAAGRGHRWVLGPGRMRTCRWSSWLARVMTTLPGPRRPPPGAAQVADDQAGGARMGGGVLGRDPQQHLEQPVGAVAPPGPVRAGPGDRVDGDEVGPGRRQLDPAGQPSPVRLAEGQRPPPVDRRLRRPPPFHSRGRELDSGRRGRRRGQDGRGRRRGQGGRQEDDQSDHGQQGARGDPEVPSRQVRPDGRDPGDPRRAGRGLWRVPGRWAGSIGRPAWRGGDVVGGTKLEGHGGALAVAVAAAARGGGAVHPLRRATSSRCTTGRSRPTRRCGSSTCGTSRRRCSPPRPRPS